MDIAEKNSNARPNIVLLVADDLGWSDVSYLGSQIQTPNIDTLARDGAILNQFYVMPSCTPTRASMMTGRYTIRYGLQVGVIKPWHRYGLPTDEKIIPQALKEVGYQTAIIGKWHLGLSKPEQLPTSRGFDYQYGCYNGMVDYVLHTVNEDLSWDTELIDPQAMERPTEDLMGHDWNRNESTNYERGYATDLIRDEAIRVIKERDKEKPLFLYVPFTAPHTPLQALDLDVEQYENVELATPKIFEGESEEKRQLRLKRRRFYAALVSNMDKAIGQILETVEDESISENTVVMFLSDNGASYQGGNNDPLRGQKMLVYEGGVRVPAVISYPGHIKPDIVVDEPLHAVDIYPTLLKLAGASLEQPKALDGQDMWPTIVDGASSPHDDILINARENRSSAIRKGDWKLVVNGHLGPTHVLAKDEQPRHELFNLKLDPNETTNVVDDNPVIFEKLMARLESYMKEAVAPLYKEPPAEKTWPKVWKPYWWKKSRVKRAGRKAERGLEKPRSTV